MNTTPTERRSDSADDGFGLIEIVVSMFMLALLAMAFLPLLVQGLKQSASTATMATATQLVHDQIELARSRQATCTALTTFTANQNLAVPIVDPRHVSLEVNLILGDCPEDYPGTVKLTATVTRGDAGDVVSTASTLVYVEAE
jgi:type II secretory pathway pseudopilin PulG